MPTFNGWNVISLPAAPATVDKQPTVKAIEKAVKKSLSKKKPATGWAKEK
jgi:hypothetical protein